MTYRAQSEALGLVQGARQREARGVALRSPFNGRGG
jgi:hypothetical protein